MPQIFTAVLSTTQSLWVKSYGTPKEEKPCHLKSRKVEGTFHDGRGTETRSLKISHLLHGDLGVRRQRSQVEFKATDGGHSPASITVPCGQMTKVWPMKNDWKRPTANPGLMAHKSLPDLMLHSLLPSVANLEALCEEG